MSDDAQTSAKTGDPSPDAPRIATISAGAAARLRHSIGDMVRSLALVLAAVAVILVLTHRADPDPVTVVDPQPVLDVARMQASFPVAIPQASPSLRPTSVRWQPTTASAGVPVWHVGFLTADGSYVQVTQSEASSRAYLAEQTSDGRLAGELVVAGQPWQVWDGPRRTSLVRASDGVTTIVSGTLDESGLRQVVQSLRTQ